MAKAFMLSETFSLLRANADGSKKSRSFSRNANFFPSAVASLFHDLAASYSSLSQ
jgi:hypothetical protein